MTTGVHKSSGVGERDLQTEAPADPLDQPGRPPEALTIDIISSDQGVAGDGPLGSRLRRRADRFARAEQRVAFGAPVVELSGSNASRLLDELGPLSEAERALFRSVEDLPLGLFIRVPPERLRACLRQDGIASADLLDAVDTFRTPSSSVRPPSRTPLAEDELYGARKYVFVAASASQWTGRPEYGSVVLQLTPAVLPLLWASDHSGAHAVRQALGGAKRVFVDEHVPTEALRKAQQLMAREVFAPLDFGVVVAAEVVRFVRGADAATAARFFAADAAELPALLNEFELGYLEGKVAGSVPLACVARICAPADIDPGLLEQARRQGIPVAAADGPIAGK